MEVFKDYRLPLKSRVMMAIFGMVRVRRDGLPTAKDLKLARKELPRFFLLNWVLGRPDRRTRMEDIQLPVRDANIRGRLYQKHGSRGVNRPLIVNYHGGGWAVGNLQNCDFFCSLLAAELDAVVLSVDYRLAPEHKFPTAVHDCYDALLWAEAQVDSWGADRNRIVVAGDSAGGNLAAAVSLMVRDLGGPSLALQALIYPAVDSRLQNPSVQRHAFAPILTKQDMVNFLEMYAKHPEDHAHPYLSPIFAEDLSGLPPAVVVTAGYDPLQDDGRIWVERLVAQGVEAEELHYPEDVHGFVAIPHFTKSGLQANKDLVKAIRRRLVPQFSADSEH